MVRFSDLLGDNEQESRRAPDAAAPARAVPPAQPSPFAELIGPIAAPSADAPTIEPDPVPALEAAFLGHRAAADLGDVEEAVTALVVMEDLPVEVGLEEPDAPHEFDLGIDDDLLPRMRRRRR